MGKVSEDLKKLSENFNDPTVKEELLRDGIPLLIRIHNVYLDAKITDLNNEIYQTQLNQRSFLKAKRGGKPKNIKTKKKHNKKMKTHKKNKKISKNKNKKIKQNNKKTRKNKQ